MLTYWHPLTGDWWSPGPNRGGWWRLMIYKTLFWCPVHRPLRITAGERREVIGGLQGNVWASVDGAIVRVLVGLEEPWHSLPRSAVRFFKPASQEKILSTETNPTTTPAPNRDAKREAQRGTSVTSVDPPAKKNMLFNVSGFRRTNANGVQREANVYFSSVFWLTVEELEDEAESSPSAWATPSWLKKCFQREKHFWI